SAATRRGTLLARQDFVARRHLAAARVVDRGRRVDQLEGQLGGAAQQRLDVLGIVDPGQLDKDAILPLALDRRLLGAGLVDPAADDLDRLVDRLLPARLRRLLGKAHRPGAGGGDLDGEVAVDLAERGAGILDTVAVADRKG